jgi:predicted pyridoxine 5'-phosphate oxidase superfamily flavin-nucleotide-binding protein
MSSDPPNVVATQGPATPTVGDSRIEGDPSRLSQDRRKPGTAGNDHEDRPGTPELPPELDPLPTGAYRLPGSEGEHLLQQAYGTTERAKKFYRNQVLPHLNSAMIEFIGRIEIAFVATSDASGECDSTLRAGPAGFLHVIDERHVAYPEYRGNGVMASLGNISENPHIGILMVDFVQDLIGLHVNGRARIVEDVDLRAEFTGIPTDFDRGRVPERWVVVEIVEAYIHCRKHIPRMVPVDRTRPWGTDDVKRKGGDYFDAATTPRPWRPHTAEQASPRRGRLPHPLRPEEHPPVTAGLVAPAQASRARSGPGEPDESSSTIPEATPPTALGQAGARAASSRTAEQGTRHDSAKKSGPRT